MIRTLLARFRTPSISEPWVDEVAQLEARLAERKAQRLAEHPPRRTYRQRVML